MTIDERPAPSFELLTWHEQTDRLWPVRILDDHGMPLTHETDAETTEEQKQP